MARTAREERRLTGLVPGSVEAGTIRGLTPPARLGLACLAAVATFVIFAHGCHGPDEDHEPTAVPTRPESRD